MMCDLKKLIRFKEITFLSLIVVVGFFLSGRWTVLDPSRLHPNFSLPTLKFGRAHPPRLFTFPHFSPR